MLTPEQYADAKGRICPMCESFDLMHEKDFTWCGDCGSSWSEVVRLVGYNNMVTKDWEEK